MQRNQDRIESKSYGSKQPNAPTPPTHAPPAYVHHGYKAASKEFARQKAAGNRFDSPAYTKPAR